jgi:MFS family permease
VPDSRADRPRRLDPVGQMLVIVGLATLTYAVIEGQSHGWTSVLILGLFALSLVSFAIFVPYELRRADPLVEVRFFRSAPFSGATAIAVLTFASFGAFLLLNTLYLQEVRRFSALHAGLCTLPLALCGIVMPPIAGRLSASRGNRLPLLVAATCMLVGALLLTGLAADTSMAVIFCSYVVFGIGLGSVNAPITNTMISGMPPAQAGVAAGIAATSRQVGATIGVALAGAVVATSSSKLFGSDLARATHAVWWLLVGFAAVMFIIALVTTTTWALSTARATTARLQAEGAAS